MAARARIALALQWQHDGQLERARPLLEQAIEALDLEDADALCARSHLDAIVEGGSCGCGEMGGAIGDVLLEMIEREMGAGLVAEVQCRDPETWDLAIHLAREPKPGEAERLDRVVHHCVAALRKRMRRA